MRFALIVCLSFSAWGNDVNWAQFKGPSYDMKVDAPIHAGNEPGFEVSWKRELGPGYSQPIVADGQLFVLYSNGTYDLLAALDANSGKTQWSLPIAETYLGHSASEDGPRSTAAVAGDCVVALGPKGHLIAAHKETGQTLWRHDLTKAFQARSPYFGFTTSPLIHDKKVVVQVGGSENNGIMAFDIETGSVVWRIASGTVGYQSPILADLAGRTWIVAHTNEEVMGLDPETGRKHWQFSYHEKGYGNLYGKVHDLFGHVAKSEKDQFFFDTGHTMYHCKLVATEQGYEVEELWQAKVFKDSPTLPLYHKGLILGKRGAILTCADGKTGQRLWRSRPPGKGSHIFVGNYLVTWGIFGTLSLGKVNATGFEELAQLQVMERGSVTNPTFAQGHIYLRTSKEIAAVSLTNHVKQRTIARDQIDISDTAFGMLLTRMEQAENKQVMIDAFFAQNPQVPIIHDERVTFIYRSTAADVGMYMGNISRIGDRKMLHIPGTDLWYDTYKVDPNARYEYQFVVDQGEGTFDPIYPNNGPSQLIMPGWQEPQWLQVEVTEKGRMEKRIFHSRILGNARTVKVYVPFGYDHSYNDYPLLLVNGGEQTLNDGQMKKALDYLFQGKVRPMIVAFVPVGFKDNEFITLNMGYLKDEYGKALAEELVPLLAGHYNLYDDPTQRVITGVDLHGYGAMYIALNHSETFGHVLTQSLYSHNKAMMRTLTTLASKQTPNLNVYMDWASIDVYDPGEGTDLRRDNQALADTFAKHGYSVHGREISGGRGWGIWRAQWAYMLHHVMPKRLSSLAYEDSLRPYLQFHRAR